MTMFDFSQVGTEGFEGSLTQAECLQIAEALAISDAVELQLLQVQMGHWKPPSFAFTVMSRQERGYSAGYLDALRGLRPQPGPSVDD